MAVNSGIDVCSRALVLLGLGPISSFDDGSDKATVCATTYDFVIEALLSGYPWRFCMTKASLPRLVEAPANEWAFAYQLPVDLLGLPRAVFNSGAVGAVPIAAFEVFGDRLFTDEAAIWIDYRSRPPEIRWPPYFLQLAVYAMAAHLADALTEAENKATRWWTAAYGTPAEGGAGGYSRTARAADANASPPEVIRDYSLIEVRRL